ncbi:hypothetical protein H4R33_004879 [Dimargaris cristalligena]|nr:hypothetical protein H4R33_004879 [Dimargaris cristalligena]
MVSLRFTIVAVLAVAPVVVQAHPVHHQETAVARRQMSGGPDDNGSGTGPGWSSCWRKGWWMVC